MEFEITNADGSHFSSEETGMMSLYFLLCFGCIGGIIYVASAYMKMRSRDWPVLYLLTSFVLLFLHCLFYYLHLLSYASNG